MADEVEEIYPEAVTTYPNGYKSVDYSLILQDRIMAVSGSDFMQGLNLLLQDRKEDRRFKAQQALTMLQFAQQKKLSEVQIASAGIDIMGKVNKELMSKKASQFISDLGLSGLYYK